MKRLQLIGQNGQTEPLSEKDRLIQDIRDYVGKDGLIAFEHGFQPTFNMSAVGYNAVHLRFPIGKEKRREITLEELDQHMLEDIIINLFRYQNRCNKI